MTADRAPISRARLSLALRIALASALFGLVVAGGAVAVGYWALLRQLDERSAQEIAGRRELLEHILSTFDSAEAVEQSCAPSRMPIAVKSAFEASPGRRPSRSPCRGNRPVQPGSRACTAPRADLAASLRLGFGNRPLQA